MTDTPTQDDAILPRPVPAGFTAALRTALLDALPAGQVQAVEFWQGAERISLNLRGVSGKDTLLAALQSALARLEPDFAYFPGIDVALWMAD